jgi:hypothetical protein
MLTDYSRAALARSEYQPLDDGSWFADPIPVVDGHGGSPCP